MKRRGLQHRVASRLWTLQTHPCRYGASLQILKVEIGADTQHGALAAACLRLGFDGFRQGFAGPSLLSVRGEVDK